MTKIHLPAVKKNLKKNTSLSLSNIVANLKRNWYFPISAMAFFCLNLKTVGYLIGIPIAFIASLVIASLIPSMVAFAKQNSMWYHIVSVMTAIGMCLGSQATFYNCWSTPKRVQALSEIFPFPIYISVPAIILGVLSFVFVYFFMLVFWRKMTKLISESGIFDGITTTEWIVYSILIVAILALVVISFVKTDAFYGAEYVNIIYTSDSAALVRNNTYLDVTYYENDLRQPLFAVFAAPFVAIPYLFGKIFGVSASVQAILIDMVQVIMLFATNFMLAKMMRLNPIKRICFMVLTSCTYTHLLFALMMEQYIVAYFWLIFCMYLIFEKRQRDRFVLWGAGGTLLTSMVLMPFMSDKNPFKNFKAWFCDMVKFGIEFIVVLLIFCRFDIIFYFAKTTSSLSRFAGYNITLMNKIYQYSAFVRNYFIAPSTVVNNATATRTSWQLSPMTSINYVGIAILLLVIVSVILNKDKKSSLLSAGWIGFSAVILIVFGWGTKENGLILYALYFGWPFIVLLFQLFEKIENKLNVKFIIPLCSVGFAVAMAVMNIPAIIEMVDFAITHFPA